jgi:predicted NUDIX family phosphoesterase
MEFVYVAPREELFPDCYPQGFQPFEDPSAAQAFLDLLATTGFFVERSRAETTPAWKQVIPYSLVVCEGQVLRMRRRPRGGEARLFGKISVGVGGHINPVDDDSPSSDGSPRRAALFRQAAEREIAEEIDVQPGYELILAGFLNDDSNAVGAVHLGLVYIAHTPHPVQIRETDVLEGQLVEPSELQTALRRGEDFESWSAILLAHLERLPYVHATATT